MTATAFKVLKNNAAGYLKTDITAIATSLTLESGQGAYFPSTFPFWVTIFGTDPATLCEVVLVGGRSTDVLNTITRAQQSTLAAAWTAGAAVQLLITAQHFIDLGTAVNTLEGVLDSAQVVGTLTEYVPTKTAIITLGGVQYYIALDPV